MRNVSGTGTYLVNEGYAVSVPRTHVKSGERRGLISIRGAGGDFRASVPYLRGYAQRDMPSSTADFGYTSSGRWATQKCLDAITDLWEHMIAEWGIRDDKVAFVTGSGGALDALAWSIQNPGKTAGIGGAVPCVSLERTHDQNLDGRAAEIETVWGGLAAYDAGKNAVEPFDNLGALDDFPMWLVVSANDTITPPSFVRELGSSLPNVIVETFGAQGHSIAGYDADSTGYHDWLESLL